MRLPHSILVLAVFLSLVPSSRAQEVSAALPKVVQHAQPSYPAIARTAHIEGDVGVKITTDGESVREAEAETGPPLLRKAAEDNARTWKFVTHTAGTFQVTFRYRLSTGDVEVVFLEEPGVVQVVAEPQPLSIDWGWAGLGKWKAELKSAHGKSAKVFELAFSGPNGEWLQADILKPNGEEEDNDFGHKDGDLLAFTINITQTDGRHLRTLLIGRLSKNKIIGTFVDDTGTRGEWTAKKMADTRAAQ